MAYTLYKNITTVNHTVMNNKINKYIVIHYTGNKTDTAKNNATYFKSVNRNASAHYFVDKTSVYQVVEDKDAAWSVGVNFGSNNLFNTVKNTNSINIEMCSDNGAIADATFKNTVELTKILMKKYNIPATNVYRHYDVCSKLCPGWTGWVGSNVTLWNKFKSAISSASAITSSSSSTTKTTSSSSAKKLTVNATYKVYAGGRWYPEVKNLNDYAGDAKNAIRGIAIKVDRGTIKYRVHIKGGGWYPYVTGYNIADGNNGYAGDCKKDIDMVEVCYTTPNGYTVKKAKYRVAPIGKNYYSWQYENEKTNGQDGYAGDKDVSLGKFQIVIK